MSATASAKEIAKTGARTYSFREGRFTTCRCPDPEDTDPWVLESEQADIEVEGYATARNTTFDVLGVPVAWLPWMIRCEAKSALSWRDPMPAIGATLHQLLAPRDGETGRSKWTGS